VVFIDPIGDTSRLASRGLTLDYPKPEGVTADLVLITHEHADHNGVETIGGDPAVLRATAGRLQSPFGEVVAIASEHDEAAGTKRGPNTIFVFSLDGVRIAHFGDFGQSGLRDEQAAAIGQVELLFLPVGAGPTIGPDQASAIVERLRPRWVVPMHYRTPRISFLEPADPFLERMSHVRRLKETGFDTDSVSGDGRPLVVVPAVP
jgi:L-ascorbate metabolism protein UlaG (beta-lactamase superfamily)